MSDSKSVDEVLGLLEDDSDEGGHGLVGGTGGYPDGDDRLG
jgi:hypothetical protein